MTPSQVYEVGGVLVALVIIVGTVLNVRLRRRLKAQRVIDLAEREAWRAESDAWYKAHYERRDLKRRSLLSIADKLEDPDATSLRVIAAELV
jgi:hypothetical protein